MRGCCRTHSSDGWIIQTHPGGTLDFNVQVNPKYRCLRLISLYAMEYSPDNPLEIGTPVSELPFYIS